MKVKIIEGSQDWLEKVPDEYAIKCIDLKQEKNSDKILTFSYVTTKCPLKGCGYVQMYGKIKVTSNVDSIIVYKNDLPRTDRGKVDYRALEKEAESL